MPWRRVRGRHGQLRGRRRVRVDLHADRLGGGQAGGVAHRHRGGEGAGVRVAAGVRRPGLGARVSGRCRRRRSTTRSACRRCPWSRGRRAPRPEARTPSRGRGQGHRRGQRSVVAFTRAGPGVGQAGPVGDLENHGEGAGARVAAGRGGARGRGAVAAGPCVARDRRAQGDAAGRIEGHGERRRADGRREGRPRRRSDVLVGAQVGDRVRAGAGVGNRRVVDRGNPVAVWGGPGREARVGGVDRRRGAGQVQVPGARSANRGSAAMPVRLLRAHRLEPGQGRCTAATPTRTGLRRCRWTTRSRSSDAPGADVSSTRISPIVRVLPTALSRVTLSRRQHRCSSRPPG